jgi:hypothetical protein
MQNRLCSLNIRKKGRHDHEVINMAMISRCSYLLNRKAGRGLRIFMICQQVM